MKLISWSVNGLRACAGKGFADSVLGLDADVICLQETKLQESQLDVSLPGYQVYLNCAASLGVSPMNCVALEDSVNGMIASKAARMRSVVVPEAENSHDPRFVLADVKLATLESLTLSDLLG